MTNGIIVELLKQLKQLNNTVHTVDSRVNSVDERVNTVEQKLEGKAKRLKVSFFGNNYGITFYIFLSWINCAIESFTFPNIIAPRDTFTATSFNMSAQNTAETEIIIGAIYKFPTEVLDQLDSYDPATGFIHDYSMKIRCPVYLNGPLFWKEFQKEIKMFLLHGYSIHPFKFQRPTSIVLWLIPGIFTPKRNGTYSLLLATRSQISSQAILQLYVEKASGNLTELCRAFSFSEREDSTCSILYELEIGDKVYLKGVLSNGKMNMGEKFGSFQAYFVY